MDRPSTAYGALSALADQVVGIEWPVHVCELVNRVRDAGGLKRADGRIQEEVEKAIEVSVRDGRLAKDSGFLTIPGRMPRVRDRGEVRSDSLHKCDRLPPWELEAAILGVVRRNYGATDDQVVQAAPPPAPSASRRPADSCAICWRRSSPRRCGANE